MSVSPTRIVAWGDDGLLVATDFGDVAMLELSTMRILGTVDVGDHPVPGLAARDDGSLVAVRGDRGDVTLWVPERNSLTVLPTQASAVAFDEHGDLIVLGSRREVWRLPPIPPPRVVDSIAGFSDLVVSADQTTAVGSRGDGYLTVWDLAAGTTREVAAVPGVVVKDGTYSADGSTFSIVASDEKRPDMARFDRDWNRENLRRGGIGRRLVALADGTLVRLDWSRIGPARVFPSGEEERLPLKSAFWDVGVSPDRERLALSGERGVLSAALRGGELEVVFTRDRPEPRQVAIDNAGNVLVSSKDSVEILGPDGATLGTMRAPMAIPTALASSEDLRLVAVGDLHGTVWIWDLPSRTLLAELEAHASRVSGLAFAGDELISVSWDASMKRWSLASLRRSVADLKADLGPWELTVEEALESPR